MLLPRSAHSCNAIVVIEARVDGAEPCVWCILLLSVSHRRRLPISPPVRPAVSHRAVRRARHVRRMTWGSTRCSGVAIAQGAAHPRFIAGASLVLRLVAQPRHALTAYGRLYVLTHGPLSCGPRSPRGATVGSGSFCSRGCLNGAAGITSCCCGWRQVRRPHTP